MRGDERPQYITGELIALQRRPAGNIKDHVHVLAERQAARHGCSFYTWYVFQPFHEVPGQPIDITRVRVFGPVQRNGHRQKVMWIKPRIDFVERGKAADKEYRTTQQDHRDGHEPTPRP